MGRYLPVSFVDVIFLLLLALSVMGGYRRGAILQVCGLVGFAAGIALGALAAPHVADLASGRTLRLVLALGTILLGGAAGNALGWLVGSRIKKATGDGKTVSRADAGAGVAVSVLALVVVTWFLGVNLSSGPFPSVARELRDSATVRLLSAHLPQPPQLIPQLEHVAEALGFPDVFVGLPPVPADPVADPEPDAVQQAGQLAKPSVLEVLGSGCIPEFLNQGSGWVAAPEYVVTAAHVVAGVHHPFVYDDTEQHPATVVAIDHNVDIAVLYVPGLTAPPLSLAPDEVDRGTDGAVVGFGGGSFQVIPAAVRQTIDALGRDVYGHGQVARRMYELQAKIEQGDSGSPFVLPDGSVAGLVFAQSVLDPGVGYALVGPKIAGFIDEAVTSRSAVPLGECALG